MYSALARYWCCFHPETKARCPVRLDVGLYLPLSSFSQLLADQQRFQLVSSLETHQRFPDQPVCYFEEMQAVNQWRLPHDMRHSYSEDIYGTLITFLQRCFRWYFGCGDDGEVSLLILPCLTALCLPLPVYRVSIWEIRSSLVGSLVKTTVVLQPGETWTVKTQLAETKRQSKSKTYIEVNSKWENCTSWYFKKWITCDSL